MQIARSFDIALGVFYTSLVPFYYVYGLIEGEWRPIDGKWLPPDEARTSTYLALQRGATMIGTYAWDGTNMTWSTES